MRELGDFIFDNDRFGQDPPLFLEDTTNLHPTSAIHALYSVGHTRILPVIFSYNTSGHVLWIRVVPHHRRLSSSGHGPVLAF